MLKTTLLLMLFSCVSCYANTTSKQPSCITLSPHLTELVYSAGGAKSLVGVSAYSNYPLEAAALPVIGDAFRLDYELVKSLQPDVIFYWKNGTANQVVQQLLNMNFNLQEINISKLADISTAIETIASTLNTQPLTPTTEFNSRLHHLRNLPHSKQTALIQISDKPIYTVNGEHWMSEAINVCGLINVFADLTSSSAAVTLESVILKKPDVIVTTGSISENPLLSWNKIPAIENQKIIQMNPDTFSRPTLRTLGAIEYLCQSLNTD